MGEGPCSSHRRRKRDSARERQMRNDVTANYDDGHGYEKMLDDGSNKLRSFEPENSRAGMCERDQRRGRHMRTEPMSRTPLSISVNQSQKDVRWQSDEGCSPYMFSSHRRHGSREYSHEIRNERRNYEIDYRSNVRFGTPPLQWNLWPFRYLSQQLAEKQRKRIEINGPFSEYVYKLHNAHNQVQTPPVGCRWFDERAEMLAARVR
eukprot:Gregarina_sp_Poly_1__1748@NODE_1450_length_4124_cov_47_742913_g962_i0_p3_GENE_NODE_1450_length_4124_cov_47_742913_g962_i0NODE_1450_length_4124_cov_47_742913_g962_i0_p3_ORF_typecomplete_len206_score12_22_NODE_1450_length_4124_cov_47_742913_g962_i033854002